MKHIISFIHSTLIIINPWYNIKIMHTNIRADILSGITVAIIALPLALAFGEISQLGPVAGIWGAIAGGIIGGLFALILISGIFASSPIAIGSLVCAYRLKKKSNTDDNQMQDLETVNV